MVANILSFSEITKTLTFLPSNGDDAQFRLVKLCVDFSRGSAKCASTMAFAARKDNNCVNLSPHYSRPLARGSKLSVLSGS